MNPLKRLIWIDIETTGLSPRLNVPLEIGLQITDLNLNTLSRFQSLIWSDEWEEETNPDSLDEYVLNMHTDNNLLFEVKEVGKPAHEVEDKLFEWLTQNEVTSREPLCGSSVHFDHAWLEEWFPSVNILFSYRNIDVSTLKELCMRYNPVLYSKLHEDFVPQKKHRVLPDLEDTIQEFKFYRDSFLFWSDDDEID